MTLKSARQQPSQTAQFTALRRALASMEYRNDRLGSDSLARHFLPPKMQFMLGFRRVRAFGKAKLSAAFPGMQEYVIARTAHFDRLFVQALQQRTPQIVLLGAGYDSRAYRFAAQNLETRVFELDAAPTQIRKRKCLQAARIDVPPQLVFVPVDFLQDPLGAVLGRAGYRSDERTLFVWEGVSYYLDLPSVDTLLAFVSASAPDSRIAFDYTLSLTEDTRGKYFGAEGFAQTMREYHTDEQLMFSLGEGEIGPFLERRGLRLLEHLNAQEIERTYLLDDSGSSIGPVIGHFCFALASPTAK